MTMLSGLLNSVRPQGQSGLLQPWLFLVLLLVALTFRVATFGDPYVHVDEVFYQTVGIAMHHGAIPYVDVWDRKPWGLFFLYYLIAFISHGPLAYQIIATLFCAATAWVIGRLASHWTSARGGLFAGIVYLLWLNPLQGFGGQTPVFYNLFIATAALLVFSARENLRDGRPSLTIELAMLLAGLAITVKPTSMFEGAFLGLYSAITLYRSPMPRPLMAARVLRWALIGAAPTLAISAWYALHGYWDIYWHAMFLANKERPMSLISSAIRVLISFSKLSPVLMLGVMSLATWSGESRRFVTWWVLAALIGLLAVPNFYMHYSLPILVPLSVATATFLARPVIGYLALIATTAWSIYITDSFDFALTRRSQLSMDALASTIRRYDDGGPLFIVDGPSQLYVLTGHRFPTPLVFPHHLGALAEKDMSHLSTIAETRRVLATRPGIIVTPSKPREGPPNMEVLDTVYAYLKANCRKAATINSPDRLTDADMDVWVQCQGRHPAH